MRHFLRIAAAVAAIVTSICAHASFIDANFFGTVSSQVNAGFGLNSPITGEFIYDTSSARFLSFTIGGQTIAPGFASTAAITPDLFTALYRAQISPVQQGGTVNSTFTLDLEALNTPWPSNNAVALLSNAGQLATNLDLLNSSFGFFMGNADGTNIRSVTSALTRFQVSAAPEPGSLALLLAGAAVLGVQQSRRRRGQG